MEMHQNANFYIDIFIDKFNFLKVPQDLQAVHPASPLNLTPHTFSASFR